MKGSGFFTQGTSATPSSEPEEPEDAAGRSQAANTAPNPPTAKIFMRSRRDILSRRARSMSAVTWPRVCGIGALWATGEGGGDAPMISEFGGEAGSNTDEDMSDKMGRRCSMLQGSARVRVRRTLAWAVRWLDRAMPHSGIRTT